MEKDGEMRYEFYIDYYFLELCFLNFCVLKISNWKLWGAAGKIRILLSALMGAGLMTTVTILPIGWGPKIALTVLTWIAMACVTFCVRNLRGLWKTMECMGRSALIFGGLLWGVVKVILRGMPKGFQALMTLFLGGVLLCLLHVRIEREDKKEESWRVTLIQGGRSLQLGAVLDTGNSLSEPISRKPVCVLDPTMARKLWGEDEPCRVVPYHCVGKEKGFMKAYLLEQLRLDGNGPMLIRKNVYVAVSPQILTGGDGKALFLLHPAILTDEADAKAL